MNAERLNEHDANQGAQSKGEFLGMAGNSVWYLLGALGTTQVLVIGLWGMLGVPLVVCLALGGALCALALVYVFALKNNRPAHYDTDFFESALIEAGVASLAFGPRADRPSNPFRAEVTGERAETPERAPAAMRSRGATPAPAARPAPAPMGGTRSGRENPRRDPEDGPLVPLAAYERLRDELNATEDALDDALAASEEDRVCV